MYRRASLRAPSLASPPPTQGRPLKIAAKTQHHSTSIPLPPANSSIYAIRPHPCASCDSPFPFLFPFVLAFAVSSDGSCPSSRSSTANTSIGGSRPSLFARFQREIRGIPIHGPYWLERSKWRRIFSWVGMEVWWTIFAPRRLDFEVIGSEKGKRGR